MDLGLADGDLRPGEHSAAPRPDLSIPQSVVSTVGLPALVRTYSGSYADPKSGLTANLRLTIRREADRGGYASLRGSFSAVTNGSGNVGGDITYGKVRPAPNLHVDITIQGTFQSAPYTATIAGKASSSGSQIKGSFSFTSSIGNSSGTFLLKKVVKA